MPEKDPQDTFHETETPDSIFNEALDYYIKQLERAKKIDDKEIENGINFFEELFKDENPTLYYSASGRSELMTLLGVDLINSDLDTHNKITLKKSSEKAKKIKDQPDQTTEYLTKTNDSAQDKAANLETRTIIEGEDTTDSPQETDDKNNTIYNIICSSSGSSITALEDIEKLDGKNSKTLIITGNTESKLYKAAEQKISEGHNISIIVYESNNKMNDLGETKSEHTGIEERKEKCFNLMGTIFEQQLYRIIYSLSLAAKATKTKPETGTIIFKNEIDEFIENIYDLKYIRKTSFNTLFKIISDSLKNGRKFIDSDDLAYGIEKALDTRLEQLENIRSSEKSDTIAQYIHNYYDGKHINPLFERVASIIYLITLGDRGKEYCKHPKHDLIKIPDGNRYPADIEYRDKLQTLMDGIIAVCQYSNGITNGTAAKNHRADYIKS